MSELTLSQLEKYILAENKAQALKEITPFTANYYFLEIMNEFNAPSKSSDELDKLIEAFLKNSSFSFEKKQLVNFKNLLTKINIYRDNPPELKKWLEKFNTEFLHISFNYPNNTRGIMTSGLSKNDNATMKSGFSEEDLKNRSLDNLLKQLYETKKIEFLNNLDPKFYNEIDLNRLSLKYDIDLFEKILTEIPDILEIKNLADILKEYKQLYPNKTLIKTRFGKN